MSLATETIPNDEHDIISDLIKMNLKTVGDDAAEPQRGQHRKHHGCVNGVFRVVEDIPEKLAKGVFQKGREYKCRIRFSNGAQSDDTKPDVRGMGIQLLGVEGFKLLPGQGHINEHHFILLDHATYFTTKMSDYVAFNRHFTPLQDLRGNGFSLRRLFRAVYGIGALFLFHRRVLLAARSFAGRRVGSLLALTYHSTTPYHLGQGLAVKYKAVGKAKSQPATRVRDGLRENLWSVLGEVPVSFDFGVVLQTDAKKHPIENSQQDWEENGAEFVKLAELTLEKQENSPGKEGMAEAIRLNPWIALSEHRPLGHINRARRDIYAAMSAKRS